MTICHKNMWEIWLRSVLAVERFIELRDVKRSQDEFNWRRYDIFDWELSSLWQDFIECWDVGRTPDRFDCEVLIVEEKIGEDVEQFDWELFLLWKGFYNMTRSEMLKENMTGLIAKCFGSGKYFRMMRCWKNTCQIWLRSVIGCGKIYELTICWKITWWI